MKYKRSLYFGTEWYERTEVRVNDRNLVYQRTEDARRQHFHPLTGSSFALTYTLSDTKTTYSNRVYVRVRVVWSTRPYTLDTARCALLDIPLINVIFDQDREDCLQGCQACRCGSTQTDFLSALSTVHVLCTHRIQQEQWVLTTRAVITPHDSKARRLPTQLLCTITTVNGGRLVYQQPGRTVRFAVVEERTTPLIVCSYTLPPAVPGTYSVVSDQPTHTIEVRGTYGEPSLGKHTAVAQLDRCLRASEDGMATSKCLHWVWYNSCGSIYSRSSQYR